MMNIFKRRKRKIDFKKHIFLVGLMFLSLLIIFLAFYGSQKLRQQPSSASGFGVSPPYLYFDNVLPGEKVSKTLRILRSSSNGDWQIKVISEPEDLKNFLSFYPGENFSFAPGSTHTTLRVEAYIPPSAFSGVYKGYIDLRLKPSKSSGIQVGLGLRIDFRLSIINGKQKLKPLKLISEKYYSKLKGNFIIETENKGEIYYISGEKKEAFSLRDGNDLWQLIGEQAMGIADDWLKSIPLDLSFATGTDLDADGLPDDMENALGTNYQKSDTDGDGFDDYMEIKNGYDPLAKGRAMDLSYQIAGANSGRLLLQVDNRGQVWYVNPRNLRRYYLSNQTVAWDIIKKISIGINNKDFNAMFDSK